MKLLKEYFNTVESTEDLYKTIDLNEAVEPTTQCKLLNELIVNDSLMLNQTFYDELSVTVTVPEERTLFCLNFSRQLNTVTRSPRVRTLVVLVLSD